MTSGRKEHDLRTKTERKFPMTKTKRWREGRDGQRGQKAPDHLGYCKLGHSVWTLSGGQWDAEDNMISRRLIRLDLCGRRSPLKTIQMTIDGRAVTM